MISQADVDAFRLSISEARRIILKVTRAAEMKSYMAGTE